jgi:A/G-specific adenine glycosylase
MAEVSLAEIEEDTTLASLPHSLLRWYDSVHRSLPWRRSPTGKQPFAAPGTWPTEAGQGAALSGLSDDQFAYGVWVSEVMLQQTQVERVQSYWVKWLAKWPTLAALAVAPEDELNAAWAGLGFYRRCRLLQEGARYVLANHGGALPRTVAELLKVPGIGPYTAAAVASIAFGAPAAAVDGNVVRVLSRLHALAQDKPGSAKAAQQMQALASELLASGASARAGDFNQAMMELGATVCKPQNPRCQACPAAKCCTALRQSQLPAGLPVTAYPTRPSKAARRKEAVYVRCVLWCDTRSTPPQRHLLLLRRPDGGLLSGQLEFPSSAGEADSPEAARVAAVDAALSLLGLPPAVLDARSWQVKHVFSHVKHAITVCLATLSQPAPPPQLSAPPQGGAQAAWRWIAHPEGGEAPEGLTGGVRKAWLAIFGASAAKTKKRQRD